MEVFRIVNACGYTLGYSMIVPKTLKLVTFSAMYAFMSSVTDLWDAAYPDLKWLWRFSRLLFRSFRWRIVFWPRSLRTGDFQKLETKKYPWLGCSVVSAPACLVPFPVRAHARVAGKAPGRSCTKGNHTLVFLSLFLPSFSSLEINKIFFKK